MLSEPRQKTKWSVNPRGNFWASDDNKFGQKILEKMGWSKGKGLGKNEDGNPEHVKATQRVTGRGLGFTGYNDVWLEHQQNFDEILSSLNGNEKSNGEKETTVLKSLEERSSKSRKRVQYNKFIRSKDLSGRSSKDLQCIFGKTTSKQNNEPTNIVNAGSMEDYFKKMRKLKLENNLKTKNFEDNELSKENVSKTSFEADSNQIIEEKTEKKVKFDDTRSNSVEDYFKKMRKLRLENNLKTKNFEDNELPKENVSKTSFDNDSNQIIEEKSTKKVKFDNMEDNSVTYNDNDDLDTEIPVQNIKTKSKKKSKKRKRDSDFELNTNEEETTKLTKGTVSNSNFETQDMSLKLKKKHKKRKKELNGFNEDCENPNTELITPIEKSKKNVNNTPVEVTESTKKKKKKSKRKEEFDESADSACVNIETDCTKPVKKKKKRNVENETNYDTSETILPKSRKENNKKK